jgi:predicted DNA-binding antitoxin AbrB/MazE fold protein
MSETIVTVYERGVLRPLTPLSLPENTQVRIQIVAPTPSVQEERLRVREALLDAGVIQPRQVTEPVQPVSETELEEAARALATAGPFSELVIAEREGR